MTVAKDKFYCSNNFLLLQLNSDGIDDDNIQSLGNGQCVVEQRELFTLCKILPLWRNFAWGAKYPKGYGLQFELRKDMIKWALKALSDSDFASDKETRISVFGYIINFCGIPIAWRSKGMKSVVLSTTEAEYMALSEVVKELKFIVQLLQTMNIEVELPITVHVDNVGAIWLSNNRTTSDRTKHIDIRTSFVKEYQEDGKIIIKFVKSEENEADIFTKNTTNVIFSNHQKKLVWDKTNVENEMNQELGQSKNQQEGC